MRSPRPAALILTGRRQAAAKSLTKTRPRIFLLAAYKKNFIKTNEKLVSRKDAKMQRTAEEGKETQTEIKLGFLSDFCGLSARSERAREKASILQFSFFILNLKLPERSEG